MKCEIVYFITFYVFEFLGCVRYDKKCFRLCVENSGGLICLIFKETYDTLWGRIVRFEF